MATEPTFPPLLNGRPVDATQDVFSAAQSACVSGEAGAGDLFWSRSEANFNAAIVLEPEVSASRSLQMVFAVMVAFADSFGSIGPPEVGVFYIWPNHFKINDAKVGECRVAMPACAPSDVPAWLVIGIDIRIHPDDSGPEPGYNLQSTSLWDEGAGEIDRTLLLESFARHFLTWVHTWNEDGFKPVYEAWIGRADGHDDIVELKWQGERHKGVFLSIDEDGNLLLKRKKETVALPLFDLVEQAS